MHLQKACEIYELALAQDADDTHTQYQYAALLDAYGETKRADEHFRRAIEADETHGYAIAQYYQFLVRNGRTADFQALASRFEPMLRKMGVLS